MNVISLLCKGPSTSKINVDYINKSDIIAWANLHDPYNKVVNIPHRLDYLFIRRTGFVIESSAEIKTFLNSCDIKKIFTCGYPDTKILKYTIDGNLARRSPYRFNASTGLIALNYLTEMNPDKIIVAGMDMFEINKALYYHSIDDTVTDVENLTGLRLHVNNESILTKEMKSHLSDLHIKYVCSLINSHPDITFEFYTDNTVFSDKISIYSNVIIK